MQLDDAVINDSTTHSFWYKSPTTVMDRSVGVECKYRKHRAGRRMIKDLPALSSRYRAVLICPHDLLNSIP